MQLCCGSKVNFLQIVVREASGVHGAALPGDSGKMEVADASSVSPLGHQSVLLSLWANLLNGGDM